MKKALLIIGTLVVAGLGWFGFWIYDVVQNGIRTYDIAGQTVGLAGYEASAVTGRSNQSSATFTERLMPFTAANFPWEAACVALAADPPAMPVVGAMAIQDLAITVMGDDATATKGYSVVDGKCSEVAL